MRPQIRSIPLCKAECPQFSWVVRNNSENVCEALQPDLYWNSCQDSRYEETEASRTTRKPCRCSQSFKPTLFPHPVTCVCSKGPCAPPNNKYRRYKLKMDQAIGDVMEDMIVSNICSPPPVAKREVMVKKTIRSVHLPENANLCKDKRGNFSKCQALLKDLIARMKHKQLMEQMEALKCECINGDKNSTVKTFSDNGGSETTEEHICKCKKPPKTGECVKKCKKVGLKCACEKTSDPKQNIEKSSEQKDNLVNQIVEKEKEKKRAKSPIRPLKKEKRAESPVKTPKKTTWKKPDNIVCERSELATKNPYQEIAETKKQSSQVTIYEHFRASRISGSSSSHSSCATLDCLVKDETEQKKCVRLPWNWQNPSKTEDSFKKMEGSKGSQGRKVRRSLGGGNKEKTEEEPRNKVENRKMPRENKVEDKNREFAGSGEKIEAKNWHQALMANEGKLCKNKCKEDNKQKREFPENHSEDSYEDVRDVFLSNTKEEADNNHGPGCFKSRFKVSTNLDVDQREDSDGKLSTIVEENSTKTDSWSRENAKTGCRPNAARPKTANGKLPHSNEEPPFNIIKQKIHSRNKRLKPFDAPFLQEKKVPNHTCVHRFTLDDRLYPVPLHCDVSGASCCVHCDKPMAESGKSVFVDQRESRGKVTVRGCVRKEVPKMRMRPRTVHMGGRNNVFEVKLGPEHESLLKGYSEGKRVFYPDSLALRHQRR